MALPPPPVTGALGVIGLTAGPIFGERSDNGLTDGQVSSAQRTEPTSSGPDNPGTMRVLCGLRESSHTGDLTNLASRSSRPCDAGLAPARGKYINLSQCEAACFLAGLYLSDYPANGRVQTRVGNRHPWASP